MPITLRLAELSDWARLFDLRNDPATRRGSTREKAITLTEHMDWLYKTLAPDKTTLYVATDAQRSVFAGTCRLDVRDGKEFELECSVTVDPRQRGEGYAEQMITALCDIASKERPDYKVVAFVKPENVASLRAFAACGFKPVKIETQLVQLERSGFS